MVPFAAYFYGFLICVTVGFQIALAAGVPWGHLAMGGKFPGRFPPLLRILALVQMTMLILMGCIVFSKSGVALPNWHSTSETLIWLVVAVSGLSAAANLATQSKWERIIWGPVAIALLACSIVVALG